MTGINRYAEENQDAQRFKKNGEMLSEKLLASENGRCVTEWQDQIFQTLSLEDIAQWDREKAELFKDGNANMRKTHRPDLD
ncbi:MAG TPA: hypothetical protein PKC87_04045 [Candidatus Absconditabacterales bacterium]|nr:hypothetical protein [Candidatus Absconditabacterales bacterium]